MLISLESGELFRQVLRIPKNGFIPPEPSFNWQDTNFYISPDLLIMYEYVDYNGIYSWYPTPICGAATQVVQAAHIWLATSFDMPFYEFLNLTLLK